MLSPIVERYLHHSINVRFDRWDNLNWSSPAGISRSISENPRILFYVRVLRIQVIQHNTYDGSDAGIKQDLNQFAKTLRMFRALERIELTPPKTIYLIGLMFFELHWKASSVCLPSNSYTLKETKIIPVPSLTIAKTSRIYYFRQIHT